MGVVVPPSARRGPGGARLPQRCSVGGRQEGGPPAVVRSAAAAGRRARWVTHACPGQPLAWLEAARYGAHTRGPSVYACVPLCTAHLLGFPCCVCEPTSSTPLLADLLLWRHQRGRRLQHAGSAGHRHLDLEVGARSCRCDAGAVLCGPTPRCVGARDAAHVLNQPASLADATPPSPAMQPPLDDGRPALAPLRPLVCCIWRQAVGGGRRQRPRPAQEVGLVGPGRGTLRAA